MRTSILAAAAAIVAALLPVHAAPLGTPALAAGQDIRVEGGEITIAGLGSVTVTRYTWRDSGGNPRSVSLVPASASTSGYAVRFTYVSGGNPVNVDADPAADGGFGYFVSHELFRDFDGDGMGDGTIAGLHGEDDSPLGRYLPSTGDSASIGTTQATQEFRLNYPRWGTAAATASPDNQVSTNFAAHQKYALPVVIRWHFVAGQDYPLWSVDYDLSGATDHIANDVRGPYGVMTFSEASPNRVTALRWGDKYKFVADAGASDLATAATPAGGTNWTWNTANAGRRHNVLSSGAYEFGLVDTVPFAQSKYGDSFAFRRNSTKAAMGGCVDNVPMQALPCEWEWAYQSMQYEGAPSRPKLAWGGAFYLGTSITTVFINDNESETISGTGRIHYGLHIVLGKSTTGAPLTLARAAAAMEADPTLTIGASPGNGGGVSFTVLGDGATYNATRTLKPWNSVRLVAAPSGGFAFSSWSGACAGVAGTVCIITMDQSRSVTANFSGGTLDPNADQDGDGIPNGIETAEGRNPNVKDNDVFTVARLFTMQQYRDFLGREGDAGGVDFWTGAVNSGTPRSAVIESFFGSQEFQGTMAPVARLYFAYFLRIPDYAGLNFWIGFYRAGNSMDSISNNFAGSAEFQDRYGALDNGQFVNLVYQNVLGRAPDAGGFNFWKNELDTGARSRGNVMLGFSESEEFRGTSDSKVYVTMMYFGMLRRAPDQGGFDYWVGYRNGGNSGQALINGFLASQEYRNRFLP